MSYVGKIGCQGCGAPGSVKPRSSSSSLCYECEGIMKIGKQMEKESKVFYVNVFQHEFAYYTQNVNVIAHKTLQALHIPAAEPRGFTTLKQTQGNNGRYYIIDQRFIEPLTELFKQLDLVFYQLKEENENIPEIVKQEMSKKRTEIFNDGITKGRNLLAQLSAGEITLNELEKTYSYPNREERK